LEHASLETFPSHDDPGSAYDGEGTHYAKPVALWDRIGESVGLECGVTPVDETVMSFLGRFLKELHVLM
jgi:hypothetical protein